MGGWWAMRDSNPRPAVCKTAALTAAPIALFRRSGESQERHEKAAVLNSQSKNPNAGKGSLRGATMRCQREPAKIFLVIVRLPAAG